MKNITPYSKELNDYLVSTDIVNYDAKIVASLSDNLARISSDKMDYIKKAYEYVRDNISHSADANLDVITYIWPNRYV